MLPLSRIAGLGTAFAVAALAVTPAAAKCTKLGFSVNDYGKDGPTKDAKDLLDKHIAKWAADNKIAKYNVGKKEVSCELFLNFIVFDEHTCRAEATVCFNEPAGGVTLPQDAAAQPAKPEKKTAAKAVDAAEKPVQPKRAQGPVVTRSKAPAETGTVPAAAPAEIAKPVTAPEKAPTPPAAAPAPAPAADKAAEAAAAAERAAAAAERAAAAAERAASAAKPKAPAIAPVDAAPAPAATAPKVIQ